MDILTRLQELVFPWAILLGDSGFLAVLTLLAALYLFLVKNHKAAFVLVAAYVLCGSIMLVLKIYFLGCHHKFPEWNIESPSGHAAMVAAIYGSLAAIIYRQLPNWRRIVALIGCAFLVALISISRVYFEFHTPQEVMLGLGVGSALACASFAYMHNAPAVPIKLRYLGLVGLVALALFYGRVTPAEELIRRIVDLLKASFSFCA